MVVARLARRGPAAVAAAVAVGCSCLANNLFAVKMIRSDRISLEETKVSRSTSEQNATS